MYEELYFRLASFLDTEVTEEEREDHILDCVKDIEEIVLYHQNLGATGRNY